jgi:N-acetylmuramoyl-L-alanine amidase
MTTVIDHPSPNFNERDPAAPLRYVVLHYTGMPTRDSALRRLCDNQAKVSAHYLIDEAGQVFHLVDESRRAWHAGKSFWCGTTDMNSASIGIELVNPGHEFGYKPFPAAQIAALKTLLGEIVARHGLDPAHFLLGHSDIAPDRKKDPGEFFPWQELAKAGFGIWPEAHASDYVPAIITRKTRMPRI